jgi:hypothetical protein
VERVCLPFSIHICVSSMAEEISRGHWVSLASGEKKGDLGRLSGPHFYPFFPRRRARGLERESYLNWSEILGKITHCVLST